jgi:hypothetical protein
MGRARFVTVGLKIVSSARTTRESFTLIMVTRAFKGALMDFMVIRWTINASPVMKDAASARLSLTNHAQPVATLR